MNIYRNNWAFFMKNSTFKMNITHFGVYLRFAVEDEGNLRENWRLKF